MSKTKLLLDVVSDIRSLADSLEVIANAVMDVDSTSAENPETEAPEITLEQVRAVLSEKSYAGLTDQVKALIAKYGASKLSGVDPKHYKDLLSDAEDLS
jgi:hypothetical protein